jgi:hypothetical protein
MYVGQSGVLQTSFYEGVGEVCCSATSVHSAIWSLKTSGELECTSRWWAPSTGILEILDTEASIAEI